MTIRFWIDSFSLLVLGLASSLIMTGNVYSQTNSDGPTPATPPEVSPESASGIQQEEAALNASVLQEQAFTNGVQDTLVQDTVVQDTLPPGNLNGATNSVELLDVFDEGEARQRLRAIDSELKVLEGLVGDSRVNPDLVCERSAALLKELENDFEPLSESSQWEQLYDRAVALQQQSCNLEDEALPAPVGGTAPVGGGGGGGDGGSLLGLAGLAGLGGLAALGDDNGGRDVDDVASPFTP